MPPDGSLMTEAVSVCRYVAFPTSFFQDISRSGVTSVGSRTAYRCWHGYCFCSCQPSQITAPKLQKPAELSMVADPSANVVVVAVLIFAILLFLIWQGSHDLEVVWRKEDVRLKLKKAKRQVAPARRRRTRARRSEDKERLRQLTQHHVWEAIELPCNE
jgi:hypothetical protein